MTPVETVEQPDIQAVPLQWACMNAVQKVNSSESEAYIGMESVESGTGELVQGTLNRDEVDSGGVCFLPGDVLYGKLRPYLRKVWLADFRGVASSEFLVLRSGPGLEPRYLSYLMLGGAATAWAVAASYGAKMPRTSWDQLASMTVSLPGLEEQRRIADMLDRETARINTLIAKDQHAFALLDERDRVVLESTCLPMPTAVEKDAHSWTAPTSWPRVAVRDLTSSLFTDGDWVESPYITDAGVRLIQTGNIGVGHYKEQGYRFIADSSFDELRCTEVKPGDVLICRLADPVGRACVAPDLGHRMITSVDVAILRPAESVNADYLAAFMSTPSWLARLESEARGGTRNRVSRGQLAEMRIPLPPVTVQRKLVDRVQIEKATTETLRSALTRQMNLLRERREALITAAVTGAIDV